MSNDMAFAPDVVEALSAPLNRAHVKEREQAGRRLSYIEGWHAIAEANRIFGFGDWSRETLECRLVVERERLIGKYEKPGWGISYVARVRISIGSVFRDGTGTGHGADVDLGLAHESAIKEAETDATKRALMTFGNPFGLALYDKTQANVEDMKPARTSSASQYFTEKCEFIEKEKSYTELQAWWNNEWKTGVVQQMLDNDDRVALMQICKARIAKLKGPRA